MNTKYMRYTRLFVYTVLFMALLAGLAGFAWVDNAANRGITFTPNPTPIPFTNGPQIGVNAYNIQAEVERSKVTRTLELARDMGARYVRMLMPWNDVEIHAKGDFEDRRNADPVSAWEKYDFLFGEMARLGLEPIVRLDRSPDWARPIALATPEWQSIVAVNPNATGPPDHFADYADFVAAVASRYAGNVRFFQLWNEPNLIDEWNGQRPDPAAFLELLRGAAAAARSANPDAVILFPSLSPTDGLDPRAPITDLEYLDAIYNLGGAEYFDILSAQAYGLGQPPDEHRYVRLRHPWLWRRPLDTRIDVSRLPLLREVMEQHGDSQTAVWISEFGYVSSPPELPQIWGPPISEEQKGQYIVGQLERARDEWPWVGVMNIWILRWGGPPPDPSDPTAYFALVSEDFRPLPAYQTLQQFAAQPAVAGIGAHTAAHPALERAGETTTFRFRGTALALAGTGSVQVSVDNALPQTMVLGEQAQSVAHNLADNEHVVQLQGGAPTTYVVSRERPWGWLWEAGAAMLVLGLAAIGAGLGRALFWR